MTKLEYTFKTDVMFKMLFVKNQDLLKRFVARLLGISIEDIDEFTVMNPEIPPEELGKKFCRLDINMMVNKQLVNVEVQVRDEGDFPERSLFNWSKDFTTSLNSGEDYSALPRTIVINILAFSLFDCEEYYSEYRPLEVTRHTLLTDKMCLQYFELPKMPDNIIDANDEKALWLMLFKADTEEEIVKIEQKGVPEMVQAISAFRHIAGTEEFRQLERMRERRLNDEKAALSYAKRQGREEERQVWQGVIAQKDAALSQKDAALSEKDAEVSRLRAEIERLQNASV